MPEISIFVAIACADQPFTECYSAFNVYKILITSCLNLFHCVNHTIHFRNLKINATQMFKHALFTVYTCIVY